MTTPFQYYLRVRYSECDAQRVVFNARYGDYVDLAITYFLKTVLSQHQLAWQELDYQVVKYNIEWQAPARFDEVLAIGVEVIHVGTTSVVFRTHIRQANDETHVAKADTVAVVVDSHTLQKTPVAEPLKQALLAGAPSAWVDHAGWL